MTLKDIQDKGEPLWFEIQAAITEAAQSATKSSADALAAAQATAKEAADKAAAELATANAARDKAVSDLAALEARSKELASRARAEFTALAGAMLNLKAISDEANLKFDEAEAAAKAARVKELEAQLAAVK
jgi:hypothetical protein